MFYRCKNLVSLDLSTFDTNNVGPDDFLSGCSNMFDGCSKLEEVYVKDERIKSKLPDGTTVKTK